MRQILFSMALVLMAQVAISRPAMADVEYIRGPVISAPAVDSEVGYQTFERYSIPSKAIVPATSVTATEAAPAKRPDFEHVTLQKAPSSKLELVSCELNVTTATSKKDLLRLTVRNISGGAIDGWVMAAWGVASKLNGEVSSNNYGAHGFRFKIKMQPNETITVGEVPYSAYIEEKIPEDVTAVFPALPHYLQCPGAGYMDIFDEGWSVKDLSFSRRGSNCSLGAEETTTFKLCKMK